MPGGALRRGDAAPLSLVELVERPGAEKERGGQTKKRRPRERAKPAPETRRRAAAG